jgi:hypothetical protein
MFNSWKRRARRRPTFSKQEFAVEVVPGGPSNRWVVYIDHFRATCFLILPKGSEGADGRTHGCAPTSQ